MQDNRELETSLFRSLLKSSSDLPTYTEVCPKYYEAAPFAYEFSAVHRYGQ